MSLGALGEGGRALGALAGTFEGLAEVFGSVGGMPFVVPSEPVTGGTGRTVGAAPETVLEMSPVEPPTGAIPALGSVPIGLGADCPSGTVKTVGSAAADASGTEPSAPPNEPVPSVNEGGGGGTAEAALPGGDKLLGTSVGAATPGEIAPAGISVEETIPLLEPSGATKPVGLAPTGAPKEPGTSVGPGGKAPPDGMVFPEMSPGLTPATPEGKIPMAPSLGIAPIGTIRLLSCCEGSRANQISVRRCSQPQKDLPEPITLEPLPTADGGVN